MSAPRILVVGEALVDVDVTGDVDRIGPEGCVVLNAHHERRRPGGAALAATFAVDDGADVTLVTAVGNDEAGHFLRRGIAEYGIRLIDLGTVGPTPQKWRLRSADGTLLRVDRDCGDPPSIRVDDEAVHRTAMDADAVLVADYGRGLARRLSAVAARAASNRPVIWDPHPRGALPPRRLDLLTPNDREAHALGRAAVPRLARGPEDPAELAGRLARHFETAVAVTCGSGGAVLVDVSGAQCDVPTSAARGDTCGAGDRFAARVTVERARGATHPEAVSAGVAAASHFVATGESSAPGTSSDAFELAAAVSGRGGRVVATGGCFDLLHAGHIQLLEAARAMGDCLIVCLNSDESVRRLKGPGRPVVGVDDRQRVVEALACVDAVAVFHEDTPIQVLERVRPAVFVKGADYTAEGLPERAVLARWGGRVAIVPLSDGRSTSQIIERARAEAV